MALRIAGVGVSDLGRLRLSGIQNAERRYAYADVLLGRAAIRDALPQNAAAPAADGPRGAQAAIPVLDLARSAALSGDRIRMFDWVELCASIPSMRVVRLVEESIGEYARLVPAREASGYLSPPLALSHRKLPRPIDNRS
jgi:hypothetical protein